MFSVQPRRGCRSRLHLVLCGLLLMTLALAGCRAGPPDADAPGPTSGTASSSPLGAAEPATAPVQTATPAGTVWTLGGSANPEGAVYDATTNTLAVAVQNPARLLLIDPSTGVVLRSVPLPGTVRHLQLAAPGGPVVVPCESANALVEVSLPSGVIQASTPVGAQPHDAAALPDGRVVVGNEFGKSLSVVSAILLPSAVGAPSATMVQRTITGVVQPGGVVTVSDNEVAIVDVYSHTISTFDPNTGVRTGVLPAGDGPTHGVLTGTGTVLVADTRGNRLLTFGLDPLRLLASIALPGAPYGVATDPSTNTVWVTLTGLNQVAGFSLATAIPIEIGRYSTVEQPNSVAVAPGSHQLWVAGRRAGTVEAITR